MTALILLSWKCKTYNSSAKQTQTLTSKVKTARPYQCHDMQRCQTPDLQIKTMMLQPLSLPWQEDQFQSPMFDTTNNFGLSNLYSIHSTYFVTIL